MKNFFYFSVVTIFTLLSISCSKDDDDSENSSKFEENILNIYNNKNGENTKYEIGRGEVDIDLNWFPLSASFYVLMLDADKLLHTEMQELSITYEKGQKFNVGDTIKTTGLMYQISTSSNYEDRYEQSGGKLIVDYYSKEEKKITLLFKDFAFRRKTDNSESYVVNGKASYEIFFRKTEE